MTTTLNIMDSPGISQDNNTTYKLRENRRDNPKTSETLGTQDTGQTKQNAQHTKLKGRATRAPPG
jgi:hypothetical protein